LPAQESHSAFLTLRQQLSPRIELFFDALASTRDAHAERPQLATTIQVPETNYYRQQAGLFTGQGPLFIGYFFGDDFGPLQIDTSSRTWTTAAGANIELFSDWSLEAVVSYGAHGDENDTANTVDVAALAPALASSNVATAFNPFGDGSNTPDAVLRGVTSSQFVDTDSELVTYALKADGGLIRLPAGLARMAIGVEHRREAFSAQQIRISGLGVVTTPRVQDPGRRTTDAYFAELLVPLLDERAPLTDSLTLSLSIRREESSDFGEATTPKIGLDWRLAPDLRLRGTWGTSFRAPQFTQMLTGTAGQIGSVPVSIDPNATNGSTGLLQILGSNRSLEPEEAESWTAGFDFNGSRACGSRPPISTSISPTAFPRPVVCSTRSGRRRTMRAISSPIRRHSKSPTTSHWPTRSLARCRRMGSKSYGTSGSPTWHRCACAASI
jgi:outer membrane receptor protein involved in Fe transport